MINKFSDYDKIKGYADFERLPKGGYIMRVLGASIDYGMNGNQFVKISCDIAEGEHAGYFANAYKANQNENKKWTCNYLLYVPTDDGSEKDNWTKRRFKTIIEAFEASNDGYHFDWNETRMKGLLIGGLINEREYEGSDGTIRRASNLAQLVAVDKIRTGNYKLPDDRLLKSDNSVSAVNEGFMTIPDGANETDGLPFA